ncbi:DNA-binding protein [Halopseudomonas sp.]|uniref:DNA-binding protein n=1 Tax=Halopseudomonas sp. TaxID=2901191 RepID=UPI00300114EF
MEQSGVTGLKVDQNVAVEVIRNVPFCTHEALAQMVGVSDDVARGWVEMRTVPSVKIGRRRVINLARIMTDLSHGKTIFCSGDYGDE